MEAMQMEDAEVFLEDAELVACLEATLLEAKQLRDACLEADIPVLLDRGNCCGAGKTSCGCAPKLQLFARAEDLPRVTHLVHQRWREMALREGTVTAEHPAVAPTGAAEAPCPACGTAAPLQGGACSDCGLQLE
jgi:hypothetical protein